MSKIWLKLGLVKTGVKLILPWSKIHFVIGQTLSFWIWALKQKCRAWKTLQFSCWTFSQKTPRLVGKSSFLQGPCNFYNLQTSPWISFPLSSSSAPLLLLCSCPDAGDSAPPLAAVLQSPPSTSCYPSPRVSPLLAHRSSPCSGVLLRRRHDALGCMPAAASPSQSRAGRDPLFPPVSPSLL
jgi:hypothetical protein